MSTRHYGATALDRLRERYDERSRTCPKCGYEDTDSGWQATTTGSRIRYRHVCPSCGSISRRTIRLD
ncbi:HVO_0649 family zinc finger protein [Haloferacaceae archaeon DSL9]